MSKQYVVTIGIEHLMTGIQIRSEKGDVLTFERESPSVVRVLSESPMECYWPAKQAWISGHEVMDGWKGPEQFSHGEIEWYANVVASAMVAVDRVPGGTDRDGGPLHPASLKYDGINKCWMFSYAGMLCGVEPDGYIHT